MAAGTRPGLQLDRRRFLQAVVGGIALSACATAGAQPRLLQTRPLLRGANVTVDATPWSQLWAEWDWSGWIKWQIDHLAALTGNSVRLIGGVGGITDGFYTLQQYLSRWEQFFDYTATIGMLAYPCGGGLAHWSDTSDQQAQDIYRAWGALLNRYDHVIGIDVTNEAFGEGRVTAQLSEETVFTTLEALTEALRQVTTKPVSHSQVLLSGEDIMNSRRARLRGISDFYDFHLYYTPSTAADSLRALNTNWGDKRILIGEVGANTTLARAQRVARYVSVRQFVASSTLAMGAFSWAITDSVPRDPSNTFGLVDRAGAARSDIVGAFQTWPTS
jgi:hypothetical protein